MGEKGILTLLLCLALGCGSSAERTVRVAAGGSAGAAGAGGSAGAAGTGGSAGEVKVPNDTKHRVWTACGTIPSTAYSGLLPEYSPGQAIVGGHPYSSQLDSSSRMTAIAMSADGQTLVSMGGVTLVWDVGPAFADSRATYVDRAQPEWPGLDISPDGRWISIFGDGRRVISREGARGGWLAGPSGVEGSCWPAEAKFSPDGNWLVGASFGPGIDVFRTADLAGPAGTEILTVVSLPAPCGPGAIQSVGSTTRVAFTPDGQALVTETGAQYRTADWQLTSEAHRAPASHGYNGALTISVDGTPLLSDCSYQTASRDLDCAPARGRFPAFSRDGTWLLAGGTLTHVASRQVQVLDATAPVGIFAPNGDVIAAASDNTLTRYCLSE